MGDGGLMGLSRIGDHVAAQGGLLTMATLGTFWAVMIRRERRKAYAS